MAVERGITVFGMGARLQSAAELDVSTAITMVIWAKLDSVQTTKFEITRHAD